jgi:phosphatidate cytidylyltransferase
MTRVLSGVALAAVFFAIVWFSNATVLLIVALIVCVLAFHEYSELMERLGAGVPRVPSLAATLAALANVPFPYLAGESIVAAGLVIVAVGAMAEAGGSGGLEFARAVGSATAGVFAIVYLGLTLGMLVDIHVVGGRGGVVLLVGTIALSDTAQYYAGRVFGRRPLAPRISPKKTIEGAIGGFIAAPIFLFVAGPYFVPVARPLTIAPLGIAVVAAGIAGDLFESMLKRAADMKDSSSIIPGHGGVLDRIDALLFATPVFAMYLRWLYTV